MVGGGWSRRGRVGDEGCWGDGGMYLVNGPCSLTVQFMLGWLILYMKEYWSPNVTFF